MVAYRRQADKMTDPNLKKSSHVKSMAPARSLQYRHTFDSLKKDSVLVLSYISPKPGPLMYDIHYELEFGIILSGKIRLKLENSEMILGPGEIWHCGAWERHACQVLTHVKMLVVIVAPETVAKWHFPDAPELNFLAPFFVPSTQRPQSNPKIQNELLILGAQLETILEKQRRFSLCLTRLKVLEMLSMLQEDWIVKAPKTLPDSDLCVRLKQAIEMIFKSRGSLTEQKAAASCKLNLKSFNEHFQNLVGISFSKFVERYGAMGQLPEAVNPIFPEPEVFGYNAVSWNLMMKENFGKDSMKNYSLIVREAIYLMRDHIQEPIPIPQLAKKLGWDDHYLGNKFREEVGLSPRKYYLMCRIEEAVHQLTKTDKSIIQIGTDLGFSSSQHFASLFKKIIGVTPQDCRRTKMSSHLLQTQEA